MTASGPLAGLRVVEFAGIGPAPMCAMLLADLGAEVIALDRLEPSGIGIPRAPRFDVTRRGRRSVALDLKRPDGIACALDLVAKLVAELAAETGETTAIGGPAGTLAIFIHVVESPHPIRYFAKVGHKLPIQATSTGRAILAQYTPAERQALYRRINFEKYSETTPTSIDAVETELRRSAERGYHQSNADYSADLVGVALSLPIQGKRLSLVVAGPMYRCSARAPEIAATMKRAVARFAAELDLQY